MIKIITHLFVAFFTAGLVVFVLNSAIAKIPMEFAVKQLEINKQIIAKNIVSEQKKISMQLSAFSSVVAENQDFAMKLVVEKDLGAPEIVDIAGTYMKVMGISFLEIIDESGTIISSGHFPASAGSKSKKSLQGQGNDFYFLYDDIKGKKVFSMQGRIGFTCSGVKLYCLGGVLVDEDFLATVKPLRNSTVILKSENEYFGMDTINTITEIKDNTITINDKTWLVAKFLLHTGMEDFEPIFYILQEKPAELRLIDIF